MKPFDKYAAYQSSVQNPAEDIKFLRRAFRDLRKRDARILREDFCGTFANSVHWVNTDAKGQAIGIDIDDEPLSWGRRFNLPEASPEAQQRLTLIKNSVLAPKLPAADIVCALNFSYFIFKTRDELRTYFGQVRKQLNGKGIFVLDCMGGTDCQIPCEEIRKYPDFGYTWELEYYNPIANHGKFAIHFRPKGKRPVKRAFTYDWRMWSIAEIREVMEEVGFKASYVYWEGTNRQGGGNGVFRPKEIGEPCETWIAYIVGVK